VLILLPPSEGKAKPESGDQLDLGALAFADGLSEPRKTLLEALDPGFRDAPVGPAAEVYTGVLYQRLDLPGLGTPARRRADKDLLIASMLWGFVRPQDRIPYYRLPPKTKLDGIGPLAAWWRGSLAEALPDRPGEVIVDMRSAAYAVAWKPKRATLLSVGAFREVEGERKAVTHMAKAVRGELARALLLARSVPADAEATAACVAAAGFEVDLTPGRLDVIVS
jgi:uncharacterized protein